MFGGRFFGGRYFGGRYFGKQGAVVLGRHFGGKYFGRRYYAQRYFGTAIDVPFPLVVTAGLSASGVVQLAGNISAPAAFNIAGNVGLTGSVSVGAVLSFDSEDFAVAPPLEMTAMAGAASVAGDLVWGFPSSPADGSYFGSRYFGSRHFGARYWSTTKPFLLTATNTITASGVVGVSGAITTASAVVQSGAVAFSGVVSVAGNLAYTAEEQSAPGWAFMLDEEPEEYLRPVEFAIWQRGTIGLSATIAAATRLVMVSGEHPLTATMAIRGMVSVAAQPFVFGYPRAGLKRDSRAMVRDGVDLSAELRSMRAELAELRKSIKADS